MRAFAIASVLLLTACGEPESVATHMPEPKKTGAPVPPSSIVATVTYVCDDGVQLQVTFDNPRQMATVAIPNAPTAELNQEKTASGIWYRNGTYELRGKGTDATWSVNGAEPTNCRTLA
jgi:membrane-bound inhibitor of C-type lysozyme